MPIISKKALSKIKPNMIISLGGGSNILNLTKDLSTAQIPNLHFIYHLKLLECNVKS